MKRKLIIDIDTDRKNTVMIGPIKDHPNQQVKPEPLTDIGVLCEALVTMIHLCHQEGIKNDVACLEDCIKHLKKGFAEAGYKGYLADKKKKK